MKKLRAHIKFGLVALICSGLLLINLQPLQASQSFQNFENWLQNRVESSTAVEIKRAAAVNKSLTDSFLKKALLLSGQTNNDFDWLTLAERLSADLYQLLLIEWNQFQAGSKMAAVPPAPTVKPLISHQYKSGFIGGSLFFNSTPQSRTFLPLLHCKSTTISVNPYKITPLVSGVAIGAP